MKRNRDKKLVLEQLRKIPIIMVACEKVGIGRTTIYRWRDEDKKFAKDLEEALTEGEALINDMSESQLISLIRDKNFQALSFWLRHRNPKFRDRVELTAKFEKQEELTPEQEQTVREALKLASLNNGSNELNINNQQSYAKDNKKQSGESPAEK